MSPGTVAGRATNSPVGWCDIKNGRMEELRLKEQSNRSTPKKTDVRVRLHSLLEVAEEQGYLTLDQIVAAFPEVEEYSVSSMAQLEEIFDTLQGQDIEVYESGDEAETERFRMEETSGGNGHHAGAADLSGIPVSDAVGLYLREMSQVPLLAPEEEVLLAEQVEQGREAQRRIDDGGCSPDDETRLQQLVSQGREAREHLIEANTRLVVSVAKRYRGLGLPFQDLIQAGNVGLIRAADRFDYRRGFKFGTYATWWIRQAITRALSQQGRTIRLPVHMGDRIRRLIRASQTMEQDLGRQPTPEELAEEMSLYPQKVRWMLRVSRQPISLDSPVSQEEGASELGQFIEDEKAPSPIQTAEQELLRECLREMLTNLTPREARVLRLRYGLDGDHPYTLKDVGDKLGVTRERVRQIEGRALRKLRHPRHSRRLRTYLS
jgi:RNA polymerase primary sigma factor